MLRDAHHGVPHREARSGVPGSAGEGPFGRGYHHPDSLILIPNGDLLLTGEAGQTIVFIHHPGTTGQSVSFLPLQGGAAGLPDDTAFPTTAFPTTPQRLFFYADT